MKAGVGVGTTSGSGEPRIGSPVRTARLPSAPTPASTTRLPNGVSLPRVRIGAVVVIGFQVVPSSEVHIDCGRVDAAEPPFEAGSEPVATSESEICVTDAIDATLRPTGAEPLYQCNPSAEIQEIAVSIVGVGVELADGEAAPEGPVVGLGLAVGLGVALGLPEVVGAGVGEGVGAGVGVAS